MWAQPLLGVGRGAKYLDRIPAARMPKNAAMIASRKMTVRPVTLLSAAATDAASARDAASATDDSNE